MTSLRTHFRGFWRRLSRLDIVAIALLVVAGLVQLLGLSGGLFSFLKYLGFLTVFYLFFRLIGWWRARLLWSLRNRLIVAYLFVAFVPVLLLLVLSVLAGQILYSQLGAYLLYEDIQSRLGRMADSAANIAAAESTLPASIPQDVLEKSLDAQV